MKSITGDEKIQRAITEVQARIQAVYAEAIFRISQGEDPVGIYIDVYTDAEDSFCVFDLVNDWLVDLSVNEGLALYVIPLPKDQARVVEQPLPHA
jgi:hypothetical protein